MNRGERVPVIRRADDDGIDILVGEELAIVPVRGDAVIRLPVLPGVEAVDQRLGVSGSLAVEIADGDNLGAVVLPETRPRIALSYILTYSRAERSQEWSSFMPAS